MTLLSAQGPVESVFPGLASWLRGLGLSPLWRLLLYAGAYAGVVSLVLVVAGLALAAVRRLCRRRAAAVKYE